MQTSSGDALSLGQAGAVALQAGDASTARRYFERIVAMGQADASVWVALAMACQAVGDQAAMLAALDETLMLDPHNLRALIMKGDHWAAQGNARAATSFYSVAVELAAQISNLPHSVAQAVRRAEGARN